MNNEAIGIGCVFALTFFLFLLRHLYLSIGRRDRSRQVTAAPPPANEKLNIDSGADNAWLLWTPNLETEAHVDDRQPQRASGGKGSPEAIPRRLER